MPQIDVKNKKELLKYNNFLSKNNANFMQNHKWGIIKQDNWKNKIIYVCDDDNKVVMSANCLIRKIPFTNTSFVYVPRGPVGDFSNIKYLKKLVKEIIIYTKEYNPSFIRFDPLIVQTENLVKELKNNVFKVRNKVPNNELFYSRYNSMVMINDLSIDEVLKNFSKSTKYKINVAMKSDIKIVFSNKTSDLQKFYDIYLETGKRKNLSTRPFSYLENMLKTYNNDEIKVVLAYKDDEVLAASIIFINDYSVYYAYGATKIDHSELRASYLLHWSCIQYAQEHGCKIYDMGVVNSVDNSDGVFLFKHGFCRDNGTFEAVGEVDYVQKKFYYFLFTKFIDAIKKIAKKFLK